MLAKEKLFYFFFHSELSYGLNYLKCLHITHNKSFALSQFAAYQFSLGLAHASSTEKYSRGIIFLHQIMK
jgi:hypothetical protein